MRLLARAIGRCKLRFRVATYRGDLMDEKWVKPTVEELPVNGECTAYAGVDAARMVDDQPAATVTMTAAE
jgi:hypothetical protein